MTHLQTNRGYDTAHGHNAKTQSLERGRAVLVSCRSTAVQVLELANGTTPEHRREAEKRRQTLGLVSHKQMHHVAIEQLVQRFLSTGPQHLTACSRNRGLGDDCTTALENPATRAISFSDTHNHFSVRSTDGMKVLERTHRATRPSSRSKKQNEKTDSSNTTREHALWTRIVARPRPVSPWH